VVGVGVTLTVVVNPVSGYRELNFVLLWIMLLIFLRFLRLGFYFLSFSIRTYMKLLLPMAGAGKRFSEAGYATSKPFIEIDGLPMFARAVKDLPVAEQHIFITREEIPAALLPVNSTVITIDAVTEGQASTCLLAKQLIDNDTPLFIGACDNGLQYSKEQWETLQAAADCIVFTFRHHNAVAEKPQQYGWVKTNGDTATGIFCKQPISDTPLNDHAITGAFWFKKGCYFVAAAEAMIAASRRINNEFYVDECINDVIAAGLTVKVLEINKYIGWGTPNDLETYLYWQQYFKQQSA
jgi:dTDP-glucose pyrophosphorylase